MAVALSSRIQQIYSRITECCGRYVPALPGRSRSVLFVQLTEALWSVSCRVQEAELFCKWNVAMRNKVTRCLLIAAVAVLLVDPGLGDSPRLEQLSRDLLCASATSHCGCSYPVADPVQEH